jgi:arginyl-tRNA--protein-N-Asp/Glu arginylyltransferase
MARALHFFVEEPRPCSYLTGIPASLEHRVLLDLLPSEADHLLDHGWRHFGPGWFRPACTTCTACESMRIPVRDFVPSRSQRRAMDRVSQLRIEVGEPIIDETRLALFHVWQAERVLMRGWEPSRLDAREYFMQFAFPTSIAREVAFYDEEAEGRLVMISICDETPRSWNAVFCFYDPAYARFSPGIANIMTLIELARRGGQRHVHLGYCVRDCQSLKYKAAFRPHEILATLPGDDEAPHWMQSYGEVPTPGLSVSR